MDYEKMSGAFMEIAQTFTLPDGTSTVTWHHYWLEFEPIRVWDRDIDLLHTGPVDTGESHSDPVIDTEGPRGPDAS